MDKPSITFYCADQNPHRDRSRGITNYTASLLRHLQETGELQMEVIVSKSSPPLLDGIPHRRLPFRTDHLPGRLVADHLHPFLATQRRRSTKNVVWHYPKGFLPFGMQARAPRVGTLHDMILPFYAERYPASRPAMDFRYWLSLNKWSIARFDLIMTVSEFSRTAILEFCARHTIRCPPMIVTYQGVDIGDAASTLVPGKQEKDGSVLHLASRLPHKGTGWLLRQWLRLEETAWEDLPPLRLVGEVDEETQRLLAGVRTARLEPPLPRREMLATLARASALVLPSEIEGFGLPALEAYAVGTPVAYVRGTAVEEILGGGLPGAFTMNEADGTDSLRAALGEILSMTPGEIARTAATLDERFAWSRCARLTIDGYRQVLS